ncbi:MAG: MMPL family transporter [Firmicutes bacterium]|nr:MMPL family transporter [Bacillota bacterium]
MAGDRLQKFGRWLVNHRWQVALFWTLLAIVGAYFSPKVDSTLRGGTSLPGSQTDLVRNILRRDFGNRFGQEIVLVFTSATHSFTEDAYREAVQNIQLGLRDSLKVNNVTTYYDVESPDLASQDGHSVLGIVELDVADSYAAQQAIPELRRIISDSNIPNWLKVYTVGEGAIFYDMAHASARDLIQAEQRAFPVIILILVFSFGALLASGIPVILGAVAVLIALGLVFFIGRQIPMFILAKNSVSMIGLGVGIDYSLFMVSRFREELKKGLAPNEAAAAIMATSGRTVLFSGTTVIIGIAATFIAGLSFLNSLAIAAITVVIVAVAAALTLLPVLLSWLGESINWPKSLSGLIDRSKTGRFWHRLATGVMKHPLVFFLITLILLLGAAYPLLHLKTYTPTVVGLPEGVESRLGFERLRSDFVAGKMAPIHVIIQAPDGQSIWTADAVARIYRLSRLLAKDARVSKVESIVDVDPGLTLEDYRQLYSNDGGLAASESIFAQMVSSYSDNSGEGRKTLIRVTAVDEPGSLPSRELVKKIRSQLAPLVFGGSGYQVWVGGGSAGEVDLDQVLLGKLPLIIGIVCLITFLVLMILFRSILIPLKSIFMNLLSVLASFGLLVLVFQDGVLRGFLGLKAPGGISSMILVLLFAVLFGLSMDYEIFLTLRMKEEHDHGRDNEESVAWGLERTGGLVTSAALIMVAVFGSFTFTSMMMIQEFGLGLAAAVFLDATLIRILLMPATMRLMGEWNWWFPKKMGRWTPKIEIKE